MEGERILKSLLNGEIDGLHEDTKNYLAPLQFPVKNKNGVKGNKTSEETISKYTLFCTKFLRCAVETLKKVKAKAGNLYEITASLKLVGSLLNNTLAVQDGYYFRFISSLDQLAKTIYLIIVQLIGKSQYVSALGHASDLLKFIQHVNSCKSHDSEKTVKELTSLALRASDTLLQGAGKLEEVKVTAAQRPSHLCVVLEWRKLSLQFQAEAIMHSSLKSLVDRTLKCGTKYQLDCGQNNVNFKCLASFFESLFNVVLSKTEKEISGGKDSLLLLAELGFHYGRICSKAGMATQALTVFDKMLEICESTGHGINGHTKMHLPSQVCCCVCFICKATISLNCTNSKSQSKNYNEQLLVECNRLLSQVLKCKMSSLPTLKLLSDALEYFRISLQSAYSKGTGVNQNNVPILLWKTFWETTQLLQSYVTVLSLQCERLKHDIRKINSDSCTQLRQQIHKITDRQVGVLSFIISSFQDQLKSDKLTQNDCNSDARYHIEKCIPLVQKASALIHSVLEDPEIPLSYNELRWLGCNVYNLGCLCYQRDWFVEGAPLLTIACDELRVWCFAAGTEEEILKRNEEVKLLTKFSLLADCQRRAKELNDALRTATTQVLISVKTGSDVFIVRQQVKQWSTVKHEVLKNLQDEEKQVERSRTLCTALAEQEDTEDIDGGQLCLVLQEELACYKAKSYDTAVEQIAVIKQLLELYIVQEDEFAYGSSMIELAIALHRHGDSAQNNDKSALECCREGTALLEQLSDKMAETNHDEECYSSVAQDRLAAAYLWQAMLEHKAAMEERQTEEKLELTESFDANELDVVGLEEEFESSLHSALETWVGLVERSMKKGTDGKIELQHFSNPEESFHHLLTTAGMLGLVNQPVKKTCALHMASILSKAIGSTSILETGVCALSETVHTMCEVLNIHHASFLLRNASEMLDNFVSSDITKVQFLLAKSHFLLLSGKFSEGENCLKEVLQSGALTHKSYKSHLIKARLKSLCAKYSVLPGKHHMLTVTSDPGLGSVTPLESALDGFYKLSRVVEEVFGEDTFSVSKKKENQKQNSQGEGSLIPSSHTQSLFHLSLLDDLLSSLLHVGQLYFHQGAVREAFRQFIDGLSLAWHFCLSHRISDFLVNIAQLELKQGKKGKCQKRLEQLKGILQPVLRASIDSELAEESIEEPEFIGHPESCKCVNCSDTALHTIIIKYCTCLSGYLVSLSRPEQSMHALDIAETACLSAQTKMTRCLDKLDVSLHLCGKGGAQSSENRLNGMQKKGKAKSAKGKKQKDPELVKNHLVGVMFSQHQLMLQCLKAEQFLLNGKVEEANSELSKAIETLASAEGVFGYIPVCLLHLKAYFLYLSGVTVLLLNKGNARDIFADCHWFAKHPVKVKNTSSEDTELKEDCPVAAPVEDEIEKPRRGLSRRGKSSKPLDEAYYENITRPTSSRTKSRGRRKKVQETDMECDHSDEVIQQKPKGCRSVSGHVKSSRKMSVDKIAPAWLDQVIKHWKEAFDLCTACPPASQFSDICKGLAFCLGRAAAGCAMYYLNLSMSVTLRHQALTSTGKRIKRITKDLAGKRWRNHSPFKGIFVLVT
ncbi:separin-like isoform X2 [Montipora foliosa]|uniref:separin-like isoform X2 n=1 Tax=Montipora foliosa TaxID=591990 RepID=UPI0035F17232